MKKYVKIALLVIVALIFIGTFVFLYQKFTTQSQRVYYIKRRNHRSEKMTTVATGKN